MVTIKDVAADARVSTASVSRVINNDSRVAPATRERVLASIAKLQYRINPTARSLKLGESRMVGVIAPELSNIFFMTLFEQIERTLRKAGYTMILCSSNNSVAGEIEMLGYLADRLIDGLIVIPLGVEGKHFKTMEEKNIPLVFVDRRIEGIRADSVLADNASGTYEAVSALIRDGFTRVGFVGGDLNQMTSRERYEGYRSALKDRGIPLEKNFISHTGLELEDGYQGMKTLLRKDNPPDAYFFVNLTTCLGAAQSIMEEPHEIQERLVCASFDHVFYSGLLRCCRYFVAQPIEEMGVHAVRMILNRIRNTTEDSFDSVRLQTKLITRT